MAPTKLNIGVPSTRVAASTAVDATLRWVSAPSRGETSSNGNPVTSQWAEILASTSRGSGYGLTSSCSSEPSSKSARNKDSSVSSTLSSATTQMIPGAMSLRVSGAGLTPRGKRLITMSVNSSGLATSDRRRMASSRSRRATAVKARKEPVPFTAVKRGGAARRG